MYIRRVKKKKKRDEDPRCGMLKNQFLGSAVEEKKEGVICGWVGILYILQCVLFYTFFILYI